MVDKLHSSGSSGGKAVTQGVHFQNHVATWFAVRMLANESIGEDFNLDPCKIRHLDIETKAEVDDILVSLSSNGFLFIQAKYGLNQSTKPDSRFSNAIGQFVRQYLKFLDGTPGINPWDRPLDPKKDRLILAVDSGSSGSIITDLREFLDRASKEIDSGTNTEYLHENKRQLLAFNKLKTCIQDYWMKQRYSRIPDYDLHSLIKLVRIIVYFDSKVIETNSQISSHNSIFLLKYSIVSDPDDAKIAFEILSSACMNLAKYTTGGDASFFRGQLLFANISLKILPCGNISSVILPKDRIDAFDHLPVSVDTLFGRDVELNDLKKWWEYDGQYNVVVLVAQGGVGKSALVNSWLRSMESQNWCSATRVFARSFYSQGTNDQATSADIFIYEALKWFGDPTPEKGSPFDRGRRLAKLIQNEKTLLVLDGLEPLQWSNDSLNSSYFPDITKIEPHMFGSVLPGMIKDPALAMLVGELVLKNTGLCVITTRQHFWPFSEQKLNNKGGFIQQDLNVMSPDAGAELLRHMGVYGVRKKLEMLSQKFGNHPLAINLLAKFLVIFNNHDGEIDIDKEIPPLSDLTRVHGKYPWRVLEAFCNQLNSEKYRGAIEILRLLGLFDRPADRKSLKALREKPVIPHLNAELSSLTELDWVNLFETLRGLGLISRKKHSVLGIDHDLDTHPLIREYFSEELSRKMPKTWIDGHNRLYKHLLSITEEFPSSIDGLSPLYAAVSHGCLAGQYKEAFHDVFRHRIQRGDSFFSYYSLGAYGADLAAVSCFFEKGRGRVVDSFLIDEQSEILNLYGYQLRGIGRTYEAEKYLRDALDLSISAKNYVLASINSESLSEIYVFLGEHDKAVDAARRGMHFVNKIIGECSYIYKKSNEAIITERQRDINIAIATALFEIGKLPEALETIKIAEEIYREQTGDKKVFMNFIGGFVYNRILLAFGHYGEVIERATKTLTESMLGQSPLAIGLCHLSLGNAHFGKEKTNRLGFGNIDLIEKHLDLAIDFLRMARHQEYLPFALLSRAEFRRKSKDFVGAEEDVEDVLQISEYGGMDLHKVGACIEKTLIYIASGEPEKARKIFTLCKEIVASTRPNRRNKDIESLNIQFNI